MQYAVIRTGGKQYRVAPGDLIKVEKLPGDIGTTVEFDDVLLASGTDGVQIGQPLVTGFKVLGEIVAQGKARKVLVFKKKRRKNYRRRQGHRQFITSVRVREIAVAGSQHGA
jgi:large subunit ribosomal protein L21